MCKQLILCDISRNCDNLSTPFSHVSHLTGRERKLTKDKRKDHGTMDGPSLKQQFHKLDTIISLCEKSGATALVLQAGCPAGWLAGWQMK